MSQLACANHPGVAAALECKPCRKVLCHACTLVLRDGSTHECPTCGALLLPILGVRPLSAPLAPVSNALAVHDANRPLLQRLPLTFAYLIRPSVLVTLAGLALLQLLASVLGMYMQVISAGVSAALFLHIIEHTAYGANDLDPPDFLDPWVSIFAPLLRMMATLLPLFLAWVWAGISAIQALGSPPRSWLSELGPAILLFVLWIAIWPLLLLVAAITRSVAAILDPRAWVRVVRTMGGDYLRATALFYAGLLVEIFVLTPIFGRIAIVRSLLLIPFAWRARLLGEAARPYTMDS